MRGQRQCQLGRVVVPIRYDPDAVTGWGTRGWNWEVSGGVDHELRSGLSLALSYHRRWFGNLRITDNLLVTPADYDPFCITAPVDSRLPNSGQQVCGLYDITPTRFGLNDTSSSWHAMSSGRGLRFTTASTST